MSNRNSTVPAATVGQTVMDSFVYATAEQLRSEHLLGELVMAQLRRAGLRIAWDDTVPGTNDTTERLPVLDLEARARAMFDTDATLEVPALLQRQAE